MKTANEIRAVIAAVLTMWALGALGPIGADWLTTAGLGEWAAVWVVATVPLAVLLAGALRWLFTGRGRPGWLRFLPLWMSLPTAALGLTGLVTGSASRGHLFVSIFLSVPAAVAFLLLIVRLRTAGNQSRHPNVVEVTTDSEG
ncbi:hypothetical protein VA596_33860 [Amycolatopsis sp., V23-08]|uniref:Uncharacterized protein n=1 Tax=Amycolatopsis heterodermiae TaxID=3110235 RepID=A0ABU5RE61_9PSEU|nr:hypothetical protein [Amycolatopsis sp., V23-08]MEA5364558.1 hypothetical protein [Amycolatopsis sp., V23-08]